MRFASAASLSEGYSEEVLASNTNRPGSCRSSRKSLIEWRWKSALSSMAAHPVAATISRPSARPPHADPFDRRKAIAAALPWSAQDSTLEARRRGPGAPDRLAPGLAAAARPEPETARD